ncbi:hypothetical protein BRM3_14715 [Brachybacterium huguangmaarense]|uniref:Integral membrane protein n=1 Tax=Brachybacterium huguangmaarense TaxID=1652028 RepID=A0ABY6G2G1_9MICO|nr:hypothetical protein [Brachybacterium huguangmaarense]UYG16831.1 hypothetical protein BRM3_14715 [Brachybacterium huguangmaarense]
MTAPRVSTPPDGRPARADGADLASRVAQVVAAIVLAAVSVLLMVTTHRTTAEVAGVDLPVGLVLGGAFQLAASVFLLAATGRRLPLVVLAFVWALLVIPFAGTGAGGGVLMPGSIAGRAQFSGWIVQFLGVGIPLVLAAIVWVRRIRRLTRARRGASADEGRGDAVEGSARGPRR